MLPRCLHDQVDELLRAGVRVRVEDAHDPTTSELHAFFVFIFVDAV